MFTRPIIEKENIKAIECRHVHYLPPPEKHLEDYHLIKEVIHTNDNKIVKNIRLISDYKRPVYITKPGFRNHNQKKEWEQLSRLDKLETRECDMLPRLVRALDIYVPSFNSRMVFRNPYIYGADIPSTSLIKQRYINQFKLSPTPASICGFDIETDVVNGVEEILMATASCEGKIITVILSSFLDKYRKTNNKTDNQIIQELKDLANIHVKPLLGDYKNKDGKQIGLELPEDQIEIEYKIVEHSYEIILECFKTIHRWMPDWVEIWNIDFDLPYMLKILMKANIDPAMVFSEPSLPNNYKYFKYRKGPTQKVTSSGVVISLKPNEQYHTVECPSSFQFIDGMQIYTQIRMGEQVRKSYGLGAITDDYLKISKFRFKEDSHIKEGTLEWYAFMQKNCPLNYIIYNQGDTILMELMDKQTKDLAFTVAIFGKSSDIQIFNSQPKRKCNELYFELLNPKEGKSKLVIGTASDQLKDDLDEKTYSLKEWIIALPATRVNLKGLPLIKELPNLHTRVYVATGDLDVTSSYPNNGAAMNISKETTRAEICSFEGVDEYTGRMQGLGFLAGPTNALEFSMKMFHLPTVLDIVNEYDKKEKLL